MYFLFVHIKLTKSLAKNDTHFYTKFTHTQPTKFNTIWIMDWNKIFFKRKSLGWIHLSWEYLFNKRRMLLIALISNYCVHTSGAIERYSEQHFFQQLWLLMYFFWMHFLHRHIKIHKPSQYALKRIIALQHVNASQKT